jgi:tetratricopeptide (TPR) repeat protein
MSCNREHELAIQCFKRSIQLCTIRTNHSPETGHILCGLEYTLLEDFESALSHLSIALSVNPRNYKAWYAYADVCFRTEKYGLATVYLTEARKLCQGNVIVNSLYARVCNTLNSFFSYFKSRRN